MDVGAYRRNKVPIIVDIALGLLFFAVAKLTDLPTAAIVGAAAGLALVVAQRFVKADLLGGLALFGIVMLLLSAALAIAFQDDWAVKMRSTILGVISAILFLGDGLLGGNRLGRGLSRYLPYSDLDPGRLALGMGLLGLVMAGAQLCGGGADQHGCLAVLHHLRRFLPDHAGGARRVRFRPRQDPSARLQTAGQKPLKRAKSATGTRSVRHRLIGCASSA